MIINRKRQDKPINIQDTINTDFDILTLEYYCRYAMSDNEHIHPINLAHILKLFNMMNDNQYINDPEKAMRVDFVRKALSIRVSKCLSNTMMILYELKKTLPSYYFDSIDLKELTTAEIDWLSRCAEETMRYGFMFNYVPAFLEICARFNNGNYASRWGIVQEFEQILDNCKAEFRRVKMVDDESQEFSLDEGVFEPTVRRIYERETSRSNILKTGMVGFNRLIGGGLEQDRVYMLFGTAGSGKSLTLLNIALQVRKYNKFYECKDKTKRPAIVILTMENSVQETVARICAITTGNQLRDYRDVEKAIFDLKNKGELMFNDDSPINLFIKYRPTNSESTGYLYSLYDELYDRGYETILLIQDHIKKIRSECSRGDIRLDLGEVVNEFKAFAVAKHVPVLSDSHLNRGAMDLVDNAEKSTTKKYDQTKKLTRANVGESALMVDNLDVGIIVNNEDGWDGRDYIVFNRIKMRLYDKYLLQYMAIPFEDGSTIKLQEDIMLQEPVYLETVDDPAKLQAYYDTPQGQAILIRRKELEYKELMREDPEGAKEKLKELVIPDPPEYFVKWRDYDDNLLRQASPKSLRSRGKLPIMSREYDWIQHAKSGDIINCIYFIDPEDKEFYPIMPDMSKFGTDEALPDYEDLPYPVVETVYYTPRERTLRALEKAKIDREDDDPFSPGFFD